MANIDKAIMIKPERIISQCANHQNIMLANHCLEFGTDAIHCCEMFTTSYAIKMKILGFLQLDRFQPAQESKDHLPLLCH
jgi:hypothetical protein